MIEGRFAGVHNMFLLVDMGIKNYTYISTFIRDFNVFTSHMNTLKRWVDFVLGAQFYICSTLTCLQAFMHQDSIACTEAV